MDFFVIFVEERLLLYPTNVLKFTGKDELCQPAGACIQVILKKLPKKDY